MNISEAKDKIAEIRENIGKVIVGKDDVINKVLICLIADGHVLLEDLPGTGKTMMSKALAVSIDSRFSRIQFTPDLLPADITGLNVYNRASESFNYVPGPVITNILLADEINRATPRTQSALLEAMQERQVTVDGDTRKLDDPFFVIATQNPVETAGTFPLPEAELDRFMMELSIGKLTLEDEIKMLNRFENEEPLDTLSSVATGEDIIEIRKLLSEVSIHKDLVEYIAKLSEVTRADSGTYMGVSPRGSLALLKAAKTSALINGRNYVLPDDIKQLIVPVFLHRILFVNRKDKVSKLQYLEALISRVEVPSEEFETA
ncbi:MAG: MoxR family ATPase [Lachnospiraceae bacterium]|nr:MoxR family ATPase [Lachnospiraceae bacterium]